MGETILLSVLGFLFGVWTGYQAGVRFGYDSAVDLTARVLCRCRRDTAEDFLAALKRRRKELQREVT